MNTETSFFERGKTKKERIENQKTVDYLTDFLRLVKGEKGVILPMEEVFHSTRLTLLAQRKANEL